MPWLSTIAIVYILFLLAYIKREFPGRDLLSNATSYQWESIFSDELENPFEPEELWVEECWDYTWQDWDWTNTLDFEKLEIGKPVDISYNVDFQKDVRIQTFFLTRVHYADIITFFEKHPRILKMLQNLIDDKTINYVFFDVTRIDVTPWYTFGAFNASLLLSNKLYQLQIDNWVRKNLNIPKDRDSTFHFEVLITQRSVRSFHKDYFRIDYEMPNNFTHMTPWLLDAFIEYDLLDAEKKEKYMDIFDPERKLNDLYRKFTPSKNKFRDDVYEGLYLKKHTQKL